MIEPIRPFLRWAGGKTQILTRIIPFLPKDIRSRRYYEPFAGAASLFFALQPESGVIGDALPDLIKCYEFVRDCPDLVATYLQRHAARTNEEYYYHVRRIYNASGSSAAQAARFIYLNKTCFNGIFRLNLGGEFNVPYGKKEPPAIPTREHLRKASEVLSRIKIQCSSFQNSLSSAEDGDFVYLDPPYPPLNGSSYFTHYTTPRFNTEDQEKLAEVVHDLNARGCLVMVSNADVPIIRGLYHGFRLGRLRVARYVTCKKKKHLVGELLITNY